MTRSQKATSKLQSSHYEYLFHYLFLVSTLRQPLNAKAMAAISLQKWGVPSLHSPSFPLSPPRRAPRLNPATLYCEFWDENHAFGDRKSTINHLFVSLTIEILNWHCTQISKSFIRITGTDKLLKSWGALPLWDTPWSNLGVLWHQDAPGSPAYVQGSDLTTVNFVKWDFSEV